MHDVFKNHLRNNSFKKKNEKKEYAGTFVNLNVHNVS